MSAPDATPAGPSEMLVVDSPYEVARWRPLVNWVLYIPHSIVLYPLRAVASAVWFINWVILIFTGRLNAGLYGFMAMYERYNQRAAGFLFGFSEDYAPFDFGMGPADNQAYPPVRVTLPEVPEATPRTAAFNFLLAIPHYIVIALIGIGAFFVLLAGWFAVIVTGAWPQGMRDFLVRFGNYCLRIWAYAAMVTTSYPRFGL